MDIRLLGSTSIAASVILGLVLQSSVGTEASALERFKDPEDTRYLANVPPAASAAAAATSRASLPGSLPASLPRSLPASPPDPPLAAFTATQADAATPPDSVTATPLKAGAAMTLTSYPASSITGILNPGGFSRTQWQSVTPETTLPSKAPAKKRFVVMLDPGHGGTDPGAEGHNGLLEKDLTLDIAQRTRLFLSEFDDFEVLLTREDDNGLSRQSRVSAIMRTQANMVVSLHFNHLPQTHVNLVETFYAGPDNIIESQASRHGAATSSPAGEALRVGGQTILDLGFTEGSARLARTLQQRMFTEVSHENPTVDDAGVKQETLFVLTRSFTPGVLIELTCLSNPLEADKLLKDDYRDRLAAALVDGIRSYHDSLRTLPLLADGDLGT